MAQLLCCDSITCLVRPPCEDVPSGGSERLWLASICDLAVNGIEYEEVQGIRKGIVTGLTLQQGRGLKTIDFDKKRVGALTNSTFSRESNSFLHEVEIPLDYKDSLSRAVAMQLQKGEFILIRQDRNDRFWLIGDESEGLEVTTNTNENGRLASDPNNRLIAMSLTNNMDQVEVLFKDPTPGGVPDENLEARSEYTLNVLRSLEDCDDAVGGAPVPTVALSPATAPLSSGLASKVFVSLTYTRNGYTGPFGYEVVTDGGLPASISIDLPGITSAGDDTTQIGFDYDGSGATPGTYNVRVRIIGLAINSQEIIIPVVVS